MAKDPVNNLNVLLQDLLPTPQQVRNALPLTDKVQATVLQQESGQITVSAGAARNCDPPVQAYSCRSVCDSRISCHLPLRLPGFRLELIVQWHACDVVHVVVERLHAHAEQHFDDLRLGVTRV